MLLQRLAEYADRASEDRCRRPYYRDRPVRWAIMLRQDGTPALLRGCLTARTASTPLGRATGRPVRQPVGVAAAADAAGR